MVTQLCSCPWYFPWPWYCQFITVIQSTTALTIHFIDGYWFLIPNPIRTELCYQHQIHPRAWPFIRALDCNCSYRALTAMTLKRLQPIQNIPERSLIWMRPISLVVEQDKNNLFENMVYGTEKKIKKFAGILTLRKHWPLPVAGQ